MSEKTVVVNIFGEEYPIKSNATAEEVTSIAAYVDSKMNQTAEMSRAKSREKVAILVALSIASELSEERQSTTGVAKDFEGKVDQMLTRLQQSLRGAAVSR